MIIVIIIPTSPTPAARNVTSSPSLDNSTQKTTTTTTRLPDPNIISNVVLQALREIIKENAVIMKVDLTKNDSIQITGKAKLKLKMENYYIFLMFTEYKAQTSFKVEDY